MKKRYVLGGCAALIFLGLAVAAYRLAPTVHAGSATELPELGRPGKYIIATQTDTLALGDRPVIGATSVVTGRLNQSRAIYSYVYGIQVLITKVTLQRTNTICLEIQTHHFPSFSRVPRYRLVGPLPGRSSLW